MSSAIPKSDWEWFGNAGHFICGSYCRFHLCTLVGPWLVSTVGEYFPDSAIRELLAKSRGVDLSGRGDERERSWLKLNGFEKIGCDRIYETMVFRAGAPCSQPDCSCGLPTILGSELDFEGYDRAGDAAKGHLNLYEKWAAITAKEISDRLAREEV